MRASACFLSLFSWSSSPHLWLHQCPWYFTAWGHDGGEQVEPKCTKGLGQVQHYHNRIKRSGKLTIWHQDVITGENVSMRCVKSKKSLGLLQSLGFTAMEQWLWWQDPTLGHTVSTKSVLCAWGKWARRHLPWYCTLWSFTSFISITFYTHLLPIYFRPTMWNYFFCSLWRQNNYGDVLEFTRHNRSTKTHLNVTWRQI